MKKTISTAAYLAGVTTLAVSLPVMASAKSVDAQQVPQKPAQIAQTTAE